ncbi:MAG: NUDIX domain-containing protein [Phycisphaerae bacterium]
MAAIDGNVARVVARLFGICDDVLAKPGRHAIGHLADQLIPPGRPGDFNQAWMDLGSAVCTPRSPQCSGCPLKTCCVAFAEDLTESIPRRDTKIQVRHQTHVVAVFSCSGRLLVRRRPKGGLWSGLWEFPTMQIASLPGTDGALDQLATSHALAMRRPEREIGRVRHRLTHRALTFLVYGCDVRPLRSRTLPAAARWIVEHEFNALSVSTAHRRVFELLTKRASMP